MSSGVFSPRSLLSPQGSMRSTHLRRSVRSASAAPPSAPGLLASLRSCSPFRSARPPASQVAPAPGAPAPPLQRRTPRAAAWLDC
jgi:hypothetical protein